MSKSWYNSTKEFMVHRGYEPCNTDNRNHAIASAAEQSQHVNNVVYVDDVEGNCIARCYHGIVEAEI